MVRAIQIARICEPSIVFECVETSRTSESCEIFEEVVSHVSRSLHPHGQRPDLFIFVGAAARRRRAVILHDNIEQNSLTLVFL